MSIPERVENIKQKVKEFTFSPKGIDIAIILIVILTAIGSFTLGRLSVGGGHNDPVIIDRTQDNGLISSYQKSSVASSLDEASIQNDKITSSQTPVSGAKLIVASKRGKKYYFTWCSGAKSLSESNKIFFNTEEEAVKAGLSKSSTCK